MSGKTPIDHRRREEHLNLTLPDPVNCYILCCYATLLLHLHVLITLSKVQAVNNLFGTSTRTQDAKESVKEQSRRSHAFYLRPCGSKKQANITFALNPFIFPSQFPSFLASALVTFSAVLQTSNGIFCLA